MDEKLVFFQMSRLTLLEKSLELQWLQWGTFNLNKFIHLQDAVEKKEF